MSFTGQNIMWLSSNWFGEQPQGCEDCVYKCPYFYTDKHLKPNIRPTNFIPYNTSYKKITFWLILNSSYFPSTKQLILTPPCNTCIVNIFILLKHWKCLYFYKTCNKKYASIFFFSMIVPHYPLIHLLYYFRFAIIVLNKGLFINKK